MSSFRINCNRTLEERIFNLLATGEYADVEFLAGNGKNVKLFKAHKAILSTKSSIFDNMFRNECIVDTPILVPDIIPSVFCKVLRYLYCEDFCVDGSKDETMELLYAARKYEIRELILKCTFHLESLKEQLKIPYNDWEKATIFGIQTIKDSRLTVTSTAAIDLLQSEDFLNLNEDNLRMFLELDETSVISEVEFFSGLLAWGRTQCRLKNLQENSQNLRTIVEPLLSCIRFLAMTFEEFVKAMNQAGDLFDDSEILSICMRLANLKTNRYKTLPSWCKPSPSRQIISPEVLDMSSEFYHQILQPAILRAKQKVAIVEVRSFKNLVIKGIKLKWIGPTVGMISCDRPRLRYVIRASKVTEKMIVDVKGLIISGEDNTLIFDDFIAVAKGEGVSIKLDIAVSAFKYVDFIIEKYGKTPNFDVIICSNLHSSQFQIKDLVYFFS